MSQVPYGLPYTARLTERKVAVYFFLQTQKLELTSEISYEFYHIWLQDRFFSFFLARWILKYTVVLDEKKNTTNLHI